MTFVLSLNRRRTATIIARKLDVRPTRTIIAHHHARGRRSHTHHLEHNCNKAKDRMGWTGKPRLAHLRAGAARAMPNRKTVRAHTLPREVAQRSTHTGLVQSLIILIIKGISSAQAASERHDSRRSRTAANAKLEQNDEA